MVPDTYFPLDPYEVVVDVFPSVNWMLPKPHAEVQIRNDEQSARDSIAKLARAKNHAPPDPGTPLIAGTLHAALISYEAKRRKDFTEPDGTFDGSGHHFLGIIKAERVLRRTISHRLRPSWEGRLW